MTKPEEALLALLTAAICSACGAQNLSKNDPSQPNTIHLEKHFQRVIRYDCENRVTSDRVEVVKLPNQWVNIYPDSGIAVTDSEFRNRSSGDAADLISNFTTFQVKYGKRELGMLVLDGLNTLDYKFFTCQKAPNGSCLSGTRQIAEKGSVYLDVSYSEKSLGGTTEIHTPCPSPSPGTL